MWVEAKCRVTVSANINSAAIRFFGYCAVAEERVKVEKAVWLYRRTATGYGFIPACIYTDLHPDSPLNKGKAISVFAKTAISRSGEIFKVYLGG